MPPAIPLILNVSQIGLCLWAGSHSYAAITRLQQWEDTSKKAAKFSGTAEHELHKTRTTQTSGALILVVNLVWSCTVLLGYVKPSSLLAVSLSSAITAGLVAVRTHLSNFWSSKSGVPLVQTYNEGIENSKQLTKVLSYVTLTSGLQAIYFAYRFIFGLF